MARSQRPFSLPNGNGHAPWDKNGEAWDSWEDEVKDWQADQKRWQDERDAMPPVSMRIVTDAEPTTGYTTPHRAARIPVRPEDVRAKSLGQTDFMAALVENRICFALAPAGAGKTYLAVWNAVRLLQLGQVDSISFFRPAIEMGAKLGFMPGTKEEKIEHYMAPLLGELAKFYTPGDIKRMIRDEVLRLEALQFLRGQNLERTAAILDEGQNATYKELQAFLTRLCEGSYFTVLGDVSRNGPDHPDGEVLKQSDLPVHQQGALEYYAGKFVHLKGIARVEMTSVDVARDPLVRAMLEAGL